MKRCLAILVTCVIAVSGGDHISAVESYTPEVQASVDAAMKSLDDNFAAFNARDPKAWAATLNYPHVRIASGAVRIWENEKEFADYMDFESFAERYGWDHSHWIRRDVIGADVGKVHVMTTFQRFNDKNEPIATYDSLYIVTLVDGHWGTQARSSSAP
jgi:hypothetical protein